MWLLDDTLWLILFRKHLMKVMSAIQSADTKVCSDTSNTNDDECNKYKFKGNFSSPYLVAYYILHGPPNSIVPPLRLLLALYLMQIAIL